MTRIAIAVVTLAWLVACGGNVDDEALITPTDDVAGDEADTGTLEQEVVLDANDYGWQSQLSKGAGNPRCFSGGVLLPSENCIIPPDRTVKYFVSPTGLSASQLTDWRGSLGGSLTRLSNDYPGWTLSQVTSGSADVTIVLDDNIPGTNKNSINTYVWANPNNAVTLDDFGRTGTHQKYGTVTCGIDRTNIVRDFSSAGTPSQQTRVLNHAMDVCFGLGVGTGTGGNVSRPHAIAVTPNANKLDAPSDRNKCLATTAAADLTGTTLFINSDINDPIATQCENSADN